MVQGPTAVLPKRTGIVSKSWVFGLLRKGAKASPLGRKAAALQKGLVNHPHRTAGGLISSRLRLLTPDCRRRKRPKARSTLKRGGAVHPSVRLLAPGDDGATSPADPALEGGQAKGVHKGSSRAPEGPAKDVPDTNLADDPTLPGGQAKGVGFSDVAHDGEGGFALLLVLP